MKRTLAQTNGNVLAQTHVLRIDRFLKIGDFDMICSYFLAEWLYQTNIYGTSFDQAVTVGHNQSWAFTTILSFYDEKCYFCLFD